MKTKLTLPLFSFLLIQFCYAQTPQLWSIESNGGNYSYGTLIKINGDGSDYAKAYDMVPSKGGFPGGHLVLGSNGLFYGTAFDTAAHSAGALFSFDPATNTYTDLYDLNNTNITWVNSDLFFVGDSVLYGITYNGDANQMGNIFRFNPTSRNYFVVYQFNDSTKGEFPRNIMLGKDNKIYGTTDGGGTHRKGVIFSFDPAISTYADIHDFDSTTGSQSTGALIQVGNSKIYGISSYGGSNNSGVIFSFNPANNTFAKIHDFNDTTGTPSWNNGLTEATNGKLYGITYDGGLNNDGVIFSIDTLGNFNKLYDLKSSDGYSTIGKMIQASDGNLYGTTNQGGEYNWGTIFRFEIATDTFIKIKDLSEVSGGTPYGYLTELPAATGVETLNVNDGLMLYPNPTENELAVNLASGETVGNKIEITDLLGRSYLVQTVSKGTTLTTIDVSGLTGGLYFVTLHSANRNMVKKFVKE